MGQLPSHPETNCQYSSNTAICNQSSPTWLHAANPARCNNSTTPSFWSSASNKLWPSNLDWHFRSHSNINHPPLWHLNHLQSSPSRSDKRFDDSTSLEQLQTIPYTNYGTPILCWTPMPPMYGPPYGRIQTPMTYQYQKYCPQIATIVIWPLWLLQPPTLLIPIQQL